MITNNSKKILIIAYHFPPDAAVGAIRSQKFVKYLPKFGWEPHVLTVREKFIEKLDKGRLTDVKGVNIVRTDFWRTPLQFFFDTRDKFKKSKVNEAPIQEQAFAIPAVKGPTALSSRLKHYLWELNIFPDEKLFWLLPALIAGSQLMRRERISCIYATIPPPTAALVGYFLALLTGSRLILDFRDPWAGARFPGDWRSTLYDKLEAWVERLTVRRAFRVITTTERFMERLKINYPDVPEEKFVSIPNGFDEEDTTQTEDPQESSRFVISYPGSFYMNRSPETLFRAVRAGIEEGNFSAQDLEIRLLGNVEYAGGKAIREMVNINGLMDIVRIFGHVPHREALIHTRESDLLLLFAPDQPDQIPGKAFEYIGMRRPILALTEDGATADLILSVKGGLVVRQDDLPGILAALKEFYRLHRAGENPWYKGCNVSQYQRRNQISKLAAILDNPT